jgi:hypothetical protein
MTIPHKHAFVVDEDVVAESVEIRHTFGDGAAPKPGSILIFMATSPI